MAITYNKKKHELQNEPEKEVRTIATSIGLANALFNTVRKFLPAKFLL